MIFNIMKFKYLLLLIVFINLIKISYAVDEIKCFVCKSSEDSKCTNELSTETEKDLLKDCGKDTECHVEIDKDGKTVRGCGGCSEKADSCESHKPKENNKVYPSNRQKCPQCSDCEKVEEKNIKYCELHKDNLGCYIGTDDKTTVFRGCESEKSNKCSEKIICKTCKDKDCAKEITLPRKKCIACNDDKDCKRPAELPKDKCNVEVKITADCLQDTDGKNCFTYRGPDNTVKRGCVANKPTEKNKGEIEFCSEDNCNSACVHDINCAQCTEKDNADCKDNKDEWYKKKCDAYTTVCHTCKKDDKLERGCGKTNLEDCEYVYKDVSKFTCYRCRSDMGNQQFCANNKIEDSQLTPKPCTKNPTSDAEKKCYIDNYDGIVIRGCVSDIMQSEVKNRCTLDGKGKYCTVCDKESCNNGKVPNSSSYLKVSFGFLIIGCLILLIL